MNPQNSAIIARKAEWKTRRSLRQPCEGRNSGSTNLHKTHLNFRNQNGAKAPRSALDPPARVVPEIVEIESQGEDIDLCDETAREGFAMLDQTEARTLLVPI